MDQATSSKRPSGSPPLRVLTLTPFYPHARDEVEGSFVATPIRALAEVNIESTVIAAQPLSWGAHAACKTTPPAIWVRYPELPGAAAYGSWGLLLYARLFRLVRRLHRRQRFDLIHAHSALPCGHAAALLARRLGIPFVVTSHGLDAFSIRREKGLSRRWSDRCSRFVYRRTAMNICVSDAVRRVIVAGMGSEVQSQTIYNGVDTEFFAPAIEVDTNSHPTILSVGRLVPEKGHELVLRAVAELSPWFPNLLYEIIDNGPDLARLAALAKELNIAERVKFFGRVPRRDVAEAMKRCTIFALPSRDEAMGCVYLEAMATARPIIGCFHQGIEEIVQQKQNGWLVPPSDLPQTVRAIRTLLEDPVLRNRIGREARRTVAEKLTVRHQAAAMNRLFRECVGEARVFESERPLESHQRFTT